MVEQDKNRFAQIMCGLAEDCSAQMTKPGLFMRFEALKQFTIEQVEAGVLSVMRSNVYTKMPTTGTIIQAIEGTQDDRAELQIKDILAEIRRVGSYESPKFKDPVTADLILNRFSWSSICAMDRQKFDFFVKEFKAAYGAYSREESRPMIGCGGNGAAARPVLELLKSIGNAR